MGTYRLDLSYDGTGFHGFARQPGQRTVQGELEAALTRVLRTTIVSTGAGRTDAGVHARQQVVSFSTPGDLDASKLLRPLNRLLGPKIGVWSARGVPDGWSARFSAEWRSYRYFVDHRPVPDPLTSHRAWHVSPPLDIGRMNEAVSCLVGEHDFSAFCRRVEGRRNVRQVWEAVWRQSDLLEFSIRATSFCHQQVRSIVGLAIDVGRGRRKPQAMAIALADGRRSGNLAPPHGLVLWEVAYRQLDG